MDQIILYVKGAVILFLLLSIFVELVPENSCRKYVRFFAQFILVLSLVSPFFSGNGKESEFMESVRYESFLQNVEEARLNAEKMASQSDKDYMKKYEEKALAEDVRQLAEENDFAVKEIVAEMTESYQIERIYMKIAEPEEKKTETGKETLKKKLIGYYQLREDQIEIECD